MAMLSRIAGQCFRSLRYRNLASGCLFRLPNELHPSQITSSSGRGFSSFGSCNHSSIRVQADPLIDLRSFSASVIPPPIAAFPSQQAVASLHLDLQRRGFAKASVNIQGGVPKGRTMAPEMMRGRAMSPNIVSPGLLVEPYR